MIMEKKRQKAKKVGEKRSRDNKGKKKQKRKKEQGTMCGFNLSSLSESKLDYRLIYPNCCNT